MSENNSVCITGVYTSGEQNNEDDQRFDTSGKIIKRLLDKYDKVDKVIINKDNSNNGNIEIKDSNATSTIILNGSDGLTFNGFKSLTSTTALPSSSDADDAKIATKKYVDDHSGSGFDYDTINKIDKFYPIDYDNSTAYKAIKSVTNINFTIDNNDHSVIKDNLYQHVNDQQNNFKFTTIQPIEYNFISYLNPSIDNDYIYYQSVENSTNNTYTITNKGEGHEHEFIRNYYYSSQEGNDFEFKEFPTVEVLTDSSFVLNELVAGTCYIFKINVSRENCRYFNSWGKTLTTFKQNNAYIFINTSEYDSIIYYNFLSVKILIKYNFSSLVNGNFYISLYNTTNDNYTINNNSHDFIKDKVYKYTGNNNFINNFIDYDFSFDFTNNYKYLAINDLIKSQNGNETEYYFQKNYIYTFSTSSFPYYNDGFTETIPQEKDIIKVNDKLLIYINNNWHCLDIGNVDITNINNNNNSEIFNDYANNKSLGIYSSTSGYNNISSCDYCTTIGKYNKDEEDALFIVGYGNNNNNVITRNNVFVVNNKGEINCSDIFYNDNLFLNNKCIYINHIESIISKNLIQELDNNGSTYGSYTDHNKFYYRNIMKYKDGEVNNEYIDVYYYNGYEQRYILSHNFEDSYYYYNISNNSFYQCTFSYTSIDDVESLELLLDSNYIFHITNDDGLDIDNENITIINYNGEVESDKHLGAQKYYKVIIANSGGLHVLQEIKTIECDISFVYENDNIYLTNQDIDNTGFIPSSIQKNHVYKCINNNFNNLEFEEIEIKNFFIAYIQKKEYETRNAEDNTGFERVYMFLNEKWWPLNIGFKDIFEPNNGEIFNDFYNVVGDMAHAEGVRNEATGDKSHCEGTHNKASGDESHCEGVWNEASGSSSHCEGNENKASGDQSHCEGYYNIASGNYSHAEGSETVANSLCSHTGGYQTIAYNDYMTAIGKLNIDNSSAVVSDNKIFVIGFGNGIEEDPDERKDIFTVYNNGTCWANVFTTVNSDYAELFEVYDNNININDYKAKFISLIDDKVKIASSDDDYILGVYSSNPGILGNKTDNIIDSYLRDENNEIIYKEVLNDKNELIKVPEHNKNYVKNNNLFIPVGLLGKLVVIDNGKCKVNSFCKVAKDGTAEPYNKSIDGDIPHWKVMKRLNDTRIFILFK